MAIAMAAAEDDGSATADADAFGALGGTATSLSVADATDLQVVINGTIGTVETDSDFGAGGAAWAWAFTDGTTALSSTVTIATMDYESTAVSIADAGEGSVVFAEVTPPTP